MILFGNEPKSLVDEYNPFNLFQENKLECEIPKAMLGSKEQLGSERYLF